MYELRQLEHLVMGNRRGRGERHPSLTATLLTLQAMPLLKAAYDRGLNTWDTANVYSNGVSEVIVGKAIKKYSIPREKLVIMTKCRWAVGEEPGMSRAGRRSRKTNKVKLLAIF
jgi:aryl-alcohol dehydrogenase-like predicted oxidoreductase